MGMLFMRCASGGISHSQAELMVDADMAAGTAALLVFLDARSSV